MGKVRTPVSLYAASRSRIEPKLTRRRTRPVLDGPAARVRQVAERAAQIDCPLLIVGETGVGKGVLARWIHDNSPRRDGPFVPVNCGAIPDSLIDSQLFGHAQGAFSGADRPHTGLVRAAEGGTLLLDEVTELPLTAQTRLLRLLEEREAQPVGFSRPVTVNVRIIVAANRDLRDAVSAGRLRDDLYFRLDILQLHLCPLRECTGEIPKLIDTFNAEFSVLYDQPRLQIEADALRLLQAHPWPGNVRELRTAVERMHILCPRTRITAEQVKRLGLGGPPVTADGARASQHSLETARLQAVNQALAEHGSVARAADALGVHRSTLYRWLSSAMSA